MVEIDPITSNIQKALPVIQKFINIFDSDLDEGRLQSILKEADAELKRADVDPALLNGANLPRFLAAVKEDLEAPQSVPAGEAPVSEEAPVQDGGTPLPEADKPKTGDEETSGWLNTLTKNWPWLGVIGGAAVAFFGFLKGSSNSSSGSVLSGIIGAAVAVYSLVTAIPSLLFGKKTEEAPKPEVAPEPQPSGN